MSGLDLLLTLTVLVLSLTLAKTSYKVGLSRGEWRMRRRMIEDNGIYDQGRKR